MIGERLKELRKNQGKSQIDVERETGVSQKNLSKYETNRFKPPYDVMKTLAAYYNVSMAYILGEEKKVDFIDNNFSIDIEEFIDKLIATGIIADINNINSDVAKIILDTVINEYKLKKLKANR